MSSRAFGILIFVAQALCAMTVPAALAEDKPPAASKPITREVIAVVPRSWPPQYDVDEHGNPVGFAIDVMNEIAARAGISVTYRVVGTFADVLAAMDSGQADIIPNSGITPERSERYSFTAPVQTTAISIIVRAKTTDIGDLSDLAGRHVGIVESSVGEKIVKRRAVLAADLEHIAEPGRIDQRHLGPLAFQQGVSGNRAAMHQLAPVPRHLRQAREDRPRRVLRGGQDLEGSQLLGFGIEDDEISEGAAGVYADAHGGIVIGCKKSGN